MNIKILNFTVAISSVILTVFLVEYVKELREAGPMIQLLGAMPNFIAATFGVFIFLPFVEKFEMINYSFSYCIGLTIYEVLQFNIPTQTFDFYDLVATWLGFIVSTSLCKYVTSNS